MKNNFLYILYVLIFNLFLISQSFAGEEFNFDVTELEILENGNKFIGKKNGKATSKDGTIIIANNFEYDKLNNILIAKGNVKIEDKVKNIIIYSNQMTYFKNDELVITKGASKAIYNGIILTANNFEYNKINNVLNANENVRAEDPIEDYIIFTNDLTYFKNEEKIYTKGKTDGIIQSKYNFISKDVILDRNLKELNSAHNSSINEDNLNLYKLSKFKYLYEKKLLKGNNIEIISNYLKEKSDKFYFDEGFIDFKNNEFISKKTRVLLHKKLFDKERDIEIDKTNEDEVKSKEKFKGLNDPRILSASSKGNKNKIVFDKAIFTSCEKNDNCPPWSMKARKITHDRTKQEIIYDNAVLNVYDIPVFYFPKFFHPDPTVDRRSGFLQPRLNNSSILGTSFNLPYFHVISPNKDFTFKPTIFDNRIYMLQNEYRQENEKSSFIADFALIKGYKSSLSNNRNSINHFFSKLDIDLGWEDFDLSKIKFFIEKINNDTYLKVFENVLHTDKRFEEDLKDKNNLTTGFEFNLDHQNYNFTAGATNYENLQALNNDRYQYVLPYYDFSKKLFSNSEGSLNFNTNGRNSLSNTNNLRSNITNNLNYTTNGMYSDSGFVNNFGIYFKNVNIMGKKDPKYKSSAQSELLNIYEFNTSLPFIKNNENTTNYLTPKVSFRINPSDMKNHSTEQRIFTTDNIFDVNRLSFTDSFEAGKSLTLGIDFKKENTVDIDKYFEIKFATILRGDEEDKIPTSTTTNRRVSNLFGSVENSFSEFFSLDYNFALDNDFNKFEYNQIEAEFTVNNFVTKYNFIEKNGEMGDSNILENTSEIKFDDNNSLIFKTRRNRKISLTEYYDLVYEYQNDCLTAGLKYRKSYYQDRDLKPKEDLFFTITLFPLTTLNQKIDQSIYRGDNAIQNLF